MISIDPQSSNKQKSRLPALGGWLALVPAVLMILLFAAAPGSMVQAKPHFSIPGLHTLQKKFRIKKRRRPKNNAPSGGEDKNANPQILPPLPARNPRHLAKSNAVRAKIKSAQRGERPARRVRSLRKPKPQANPDRDVTQIVLPPLPMRKPRRHPSQVKEQDWSQALIADAAAQCAALGITITPMPSVKKGLCGNPAPVLLPKIGTSTIRPAATLSCPMAASLEHWFSRSVQPLAQKHFGKKVRQIRNISSYVCRNRYGDTDSRISEHAYANALDISWFELEGGEKIFVETDWNNEQDAEKSAFLHALHKSACGLFGTVLGPDANDAHKNHFHLDRAPRKRSNYCR